MTRAAPVSLWRIGLGVATLVLLGIVAYLNPIRQADPKADRAGPITYDQQISIPKIPGGASSMRSLAEEASVPDGTGNTGDQVGVVSRWTAIKNGNDPGQLLINLTSIHLWRKVERSAEFQYIPRPHTMDENRNKPILYELIMDQFRCYDGFASKLRLNAYYEDGTKQPYFPWGYESPWTRVEPDTALSNELKVVCGVELMSDPAQSAKIDDGRVLGAWRVENGAQGKIAPGPFVISEKTIAWTAQDNGICVLNYEIASRSTGSTFPGGPMDSKPNDEYTTFVLELPGPHPQACAQKINSFTISLESDQSNVAHVAAFWGAVQGYGTMRRVVQNNE